MGSEQGESAVPGQGTGRFAALRDGLPSFIARTARYGMVGASVATLYSGLVIFFHQGLGIAEPDLASLLGFVIAVPIGYVGHWGITFQRRHRFLEGWQRFAVLNAIGFVVAVPGMHLVTHIFGWSYLFGVALTWVISPLMNYIVLQFWVFSHRRAR